MQKLLLTLAAVVAYAPGAMATAPGKSDSAISTTAFTPEKIHHLHFRFLLVSYDRARRDLSIAPFGLEFH